MTMFYIHKIHAHLLREARGLYVIPYKFIQFIIGQHVLITLYFKFFVQNRMPVRNLGFVGKFVIGPTETARMRKLKPDHKILRAAILFLVCIQENIT